MRSILAGVSIFGALFLRIAAAAPDTAGLELFENKVRPLLAQQCYACHSKTKVAGLRLDSREDMLKGGDNGPALVPGDPDKSLLVKALRHEGDLKMPKGGKLKAPDIQAVTDWVKMGAPWPVAAVTRKEEKGGFSITPEQRSHWSFQPLHKPAIPAVKNAAWAKNDIDRFILARLENEGLQPVREADRRTLLRRVTYDLTGLPPTPEQVDAFLKDSSPKALETVVDRLLASEAYGERWGRHWLDVTRFAEDDTRGLAPMGRGHEPYKYGYLYRDWVIRAVNDDMPYGQFLKAHLAADQMDDRDRARMLPALGFLGQGPWYYDLVEPPIARADERNERVDVVTRGFLGLTVGCARCHDHKYDPLSMKDYYALAGVFNSTVYHEYPLVPKKLEDEFKAKEKKIEAMEKGLKEFSNTASQQLAEVLSRKMVKYLVAVWKVEADKQSPEQVAAKDKLDTELLQRWIKFTKKPASFYPDMKPWQAMMKRGGSEKDAEKLAAEFQNTVQAIVAERAEMKKQNERMLASTTPDDEVKSVNLPNGFKSFFDKHQLELKTLSREKMNLYTDIFLFEMSDEPEQPGRRFKPGLLVFRDWGLERQLSPEWNEHIASVRAEIEKLRKEMGSMPFVHGVAEAEKPANLKVHLRGSPYNLGDDVPRRFLEILSADTPSPFAKGSGRLELAGKIVEAPITARVIANRIWKWHFGSGLTETPSNFGFAGERPSHPELLEYLAAAFVEDGMSWKKLHKRIVLSATYQLATETQAQNAAKDPANRLHWRANRQRLSAEAIRDSVLFYAGSLDKKMYGPSDELTDTNLRRAVYGKVSRFKLDSYLQLFDFPNPNISAEKRHTTNVPLQRLFFLNSPFLMKQAETFTKRLASERTDEAKIRKSYRILFQRDVTPGELQAGLEFLSDEKKRRAEEEKKSPKDPATVSEKQDEDKPLQKGAETGWFDPQEGQKADTKMPAPDKPTMADAKPETKSEAKPDAAKPAAGKDTDKDKAKPVDPWALYVKVLLSSNETLYVN